MDALRIPALAISLGATVASVSYTLGSLATNIVAESSGLAIGMTGKAASIGTNILLGPIAGFGVRKFSTIASDQTKQTLRASGTTMSVGLAAVTGSVTVLLITAGSKLVGHFHKPTQDNIEENVVVQAIDDDPQVDSDILNSPK